MYKMTIFNKGVETIIHYPTADAESPKIITKHMNKKRGQAGSLTFSIFPNNIGFNLLTRMATLITVTDTRDQKEVFSGRVYTNKRGMDDNGLFKKDIICEGELNFLHDTVVNSEIYEDKTPVQLLQIFLDAHNASVEEYKKIYLGVVNVDDWLFCTTALETTLEAITKYIYKEELGYLQLRKVGGIKYLDYLKSTTDKIIDVELTKNLLNLMQTDDKDFGTRIVPLGANSLTIENVNGGLNYLEDAAAVAQYGIIYKTVEFKDITSDVELKSQCELQLSSYTTPKKSLEIGALELATLANTSENMIDENTSVHVKNEVMGIDEVWKVVEFDVDLSEAWKPKLTLSDKSISLTGTLSSIIGSMVRNDADYNGVQVGDAFGIRIKNDLITMLLNAKVGISISNDGKTVFYVDGNGKLVAVDITCVDMVATRGVFNDIVANNGTYNNINAVNMIATLMRTSNTSDYMIFHDQYTEYYHLNILRMKVGFDGINNYPAITLYTDNGVDIAGAITAGNNSPSLEGNWTVENGSGFYVYGNTNLATQNWVQGQGFASSSDLADLYQIISILESRIATLENA